MRRFAQLLPVILAGSIWVLAGPAARAAEVKITSDSFVRAEIGGIVAELDRQKLVGRNRSGTLTLASPSSDLTVRVRALGEPAIGLLATAYPTVSDSGKYGIARLLVEQGEAGCRMLSELLKRRDLPGRRWILQAIGGTYTAPLVTALREVVLDPDPEVAELAISELAETDDDLGITILRRIVDGPAPRLALAAAKALGFMKDSTGARLLVESLRTTRSATGGRSTGAELMTRLKIIQALGTSGAPEAVEPLVRLFVEAVPSVGEDEPLPTAQGSGMLALRGRPVEPTTKAMLEASYAATALASLSQRRPRPGIDAQLSHPNLHVRRMSLEILASCADASSIPALARLLGAGADSPRGRLTDAFSALALGKESNRESILAGQALRQIGGAPALRTLETARQRASESLAPWLAICLAALDEPEGLKQTIALARGSDSEFKVSAISALGLARSRAAVDALASLTETSDVQIRLLAASSLSRPGNLAAQGALGKLLEKSQATDDRQGTSVAALGLGMAGDERAVPTLERLVQDSDPSIRKAAVVGLFYLTGRAYRYTNVWGAPSQFEPTTFHQKLRSDRLARLPARR